ncbi:hypothetical protein A3D03_04705 [Candidatus Gottesmanbacteria bacterium RIFCSPHIGHO2_02_FULL_40_13]|uniref:Fido domain-containing protein n=1 Tax=Candidatus Gottesmanbacteria bacterium RIFCSPHIGHO2_02_FULL_40_13 TaxID=1798384 RepID=A0A1F6ACR2_9BACT|nr:MAG: hypothetical protein A3D03_04705 [Candidatus Gottesmanbacteria bacterium RIFCSPHIGHO2_02_FULL_40_13]
MKVNYVVIDEVFAIHERMLNIGGGRQGIRDFTLIHSAIERPKATFAQKDLYPSIWLKAAAIIQSLVRNHLFNDGNKRTALATTVRFLHINGYKIAASHKEIVDFTLNIQKKNFHFEDISTWLKKNSCRVQPCKANIFRAAARGS